MIKKTILLFMLLLGSQVHVIVAQPDCTECKKMLKQYYKKLDASIKKHNRKTVYTRMQYTSRLAKNKLHSLVQNPEVHTTVELYAFNNRSLYKNDQIEMYMDENDLFTVLKKDKLIVRSDINGNSHNNTNVMRNLFRDSLLIQSNILSCTPAPRRYGSHARAIRLELSDAYKNLTKAKECTVYFDKKSNTLLALDIVYVPGYRMSHQQITYEEMEFINYPVLKNPVCEHFISKQGTVSDKYAQYQFQDNRTRTP